MSRGTPNIYDIIKRPEEYLEDCPLREWYRGIVEDVNDPEKRGRVRVRIESIFRSQPGNPSGGVGDSSVTTTLSPSRPGEDQGDSVKTNELPWADVVIHGQGTKYGCFNTPLVGDAVIVIFEFGHPTNPLVLGGWWGMAGTPKRTEVPLAAQGGDQSAQPGSPEIPVGAPGNINGTNPIPAVAPIPGETGNDKKGLDVGVVGVTGVTLNEPANPYAATYPNNQVFKAPSGHLVEFDNTAGAERVNITHKSGTWAEFHPDGALVFGVQGKRYTLVVGEDEQHYKENQHIVIDKNSTRKVLGDVTEETEGNLSTKVTKDQVIESTGITTVKSIGNMKVQSVGNSVTIKAKTKITTQAPTYKIEGDAAGTPATSYDIQASAINLSASGATGFPVVTTGTHPVDYITGIPIIGLPNVTAGL